MRAVEPVLDFHDQVLNDFRDASSPCVEGAYFLIEELETQDPDLDEKCGLLDDRYEVYALKVPKCSSLSLIVSLDTSQEEPWPCTLHGLVRKRADA